MSRPHHASSVTSDRAERLGWAGPTVVHQPGSVQRSIQRPPLDTAGQSGQVPQAVDEPADRPEPARPSSRSSDFRTSSEFGNPGGNWLG